MQPAPQPSLIALLGLSRRASSSSLSSALGGATGLQLEHVEQLFGNGLRSELELCSVVEVTTEPDPDGRLVRRPESRRSADLTTRSYGWSLDLRRPPTVLSHELRLVT
jgi:hypothetical protein